MRREGGRIEGSKRRRGGGKEEKEGGVTGLGGRGGEERGGRGGRGLFLRVGETVAIGIMFLNGAKKGCHSKPVRRTPMLCVGVMFHSLSLASPPGGCTQLVLNLDVPRFGRNGLQTCYG